MSFAKWKLFKRLSLYGLFFWCQPMQQLLHQHKACMIIYRIKFNNSIYQIYWCSEKYFKCIHISRYSIGQLSCNICTNNGGCTRGDSNFDINLGQNLSPSDCQGQCQTRMQSIGWNKGCWIIAPDGNCYGRNGYLIIVSRGN